MRCEISVKLINLHACPGDRDPKEVTVAKGRIVKIKKTITDERVGRADIEAEKDLSFDQGREKTTEEKRGTIQPLYAFLEENGKPLFRIGGPYGKLMGLLKEAGSFLYTQKVPGFRTGYKKILKSMIVKPQWVKLDDATEVENVKIPQIMAGRSKAMILQFYEKIAHCTANITIDMPDSIKDQFETLIKQAEGMPFGPKRRGELRILEMNWSN